MAWANVATNSPIANWLGLSRRNVCTIRGENWPIANCTTTIVIVSTKVANDTIDTAIVVRMPIAASGPPVNQRGIKLEASSPIDRDRADRQKHSRQHTHHRDEPEARSNAGQARRGSHVAPSLPA